MPAGKLQQQQQQQRRQQCRGLAGAGCCQLAETPGPRRSLPEDTSTPGRATFGHILFFRFCVDDAGRSLERLINTGAVSS